MESSGEISAQPSTVVAWSPDHATGPNTGPQAVGGRPVVGDVRGRETRAQLDPRHHPWSEILGGRNY